MEKIEMPTAQNVKVEYQLGSIIDRGLGYLIDVFILGITIGFLSLVSAVIIRSSTLALIFGVPVFVFYTLGFELFNQGQTPGKKLIGLRVVKTDGKLPDFRSYLIRYVFRLVDIYMTAYTVGILSIVGSRRNQRLGDLLADTTVVKVKGGRRYNFTGVVSTKKVEEHEIAYPDIVRLSEDEMLVVQECLQRYRKYKNPAHKEALNLAALKVKDVIGYGQETDAVAFLDRCIKDYVQLTR